MKNRIAAFLLLSIWMVFLFVPIFGRCSKNDTKTETETVMLQEMSSQPATADVEQLLSYEQEEAYVNGEIAKMNEEMAAITSIKDKKEWFVAYKGIIGTYSDVIDPPETIYDCFTGEELDLLFRVVQAEIGDYSFEQKVNVSSVIFNRLDNERFPNRLRDVLLAPGQFQTVFNGRYKTVQVSEDTILACEYAFEIEDTTNGCLFFEAKNYKVHEKYATFLFEDDSGHKFYK